MKNETLMRILNLMEQGVITAEEAADLIDALYDTGDRTEAGTAEDRNAKQSEESAETARSLFDKIARAVEEATQTATEAVRKIDWRSLGNTIRNQTQRGLEEMRKALADLEQRDWSLGAWGKHHMETKQEMSLPLTTGQTLTVELPAGDVFITGGFDGGRVEATIHLQGADPNLLQETLRAYTLVAEQTPEGVLLRTPELEGGIGQRVDLELQLPRAVNLRIEVKHQGDITVEKVDGMLMLKTQHGDIAVRHATGTMHLETLRGDLVLNEAQGDSARLHLLHGDVQVHRARFESLQANIANGDTQIEEGAIRVLKIETVKGDIEAELTQPITDTVQLYTVSGDITLRVPDGNDCTVELCTVAGDIEYGLSGQTLEHEPRRVKAVYGAGTGSLMMETVHGDIDLQLRAHPTS